MNIGKGIAIASMWFTGGYLSKILIEIGKGEAIVFIWPVICLFTLLILFGEPD